MGSNRAALLYCGRGYQLGCLQPYPIMESNRLVSALSTEVGATPDPCPTHKSKLGRYVWESLTKSEGLKTGKVKFNRNIILGRKHQSKRFINT